MTMDSHILDALGLTGGALATLYDGWYTARIVDRLPVNAKEKTDSKTGKAYTSYTLPIVLEIGSASQMLTTYCPAWVIRNILNAVGAPVLTEQALDDAKGKEIRIRIQARESADSVDDDVDAISDANESAPAGFWNIAEIRERKPRHPAWDAPIQEQYAQSGNKNIGKDKGGKNPFLTMLGA